MLATDFNTQEATLLDALVNAHQSTSLRDGRGDLLCACGKPWLYRIPGSDEEGCRQVRRLRKCLRTSQRGI